MLAEGLAVVARQHHQAVARRAALGQFLQQGIDAYRNRDLFVNSVNWLLGDVEAISIRPNQSRASRLTLSTEQLSQIRYVALFVLPQAIAIVGVLAWWSRRRAQGR